MKKFFKTAIFIALIISILACVIACDGTSDTYEVTFMVDGEVYHKLTLSVGEEINPDVIPQDPQKNGYVFIGWFLDENGSTEIDEQTMKTSCTLYAVFEIVNNPDVPVNPDKPGEPEQGENETVKMTVTFDSRGGSEQANRAFAVGAVMDLPIPTKSGYTFLGWIDEENDVYTSQSVMPSKNLTLYAVWESKVSTFKDEYVTFEQAKEGKKQPDAFYTGYDNIHTYLVVELTSDDLGGADKVGLNNNLDLVEETKLDYSVNPGYVASWFEGNFNTPNGAQVFTLNYGSNIQLITVAEDNQIKRRYLVDIYVKYDYYAYLYENVYADTYYDAVRVFEYDTLPETTPYKTVSPFSVSDRVYYNTATSDYQSFNYSTLFTSNINLYQTYEEETITTVLNGGTITEEIAIQPYTEITLEIPEKADSYFLGWQTSDGKYLTDYSGKAVSVMLTKDNASVFSAITATYYDGIRYQAVSDNGIITFEKTYPVIVYTDDTCTVIEEIAFVKQNSYATAPEKPYDSGLVFTKWNTYDANGNKVDFDFNQAVVGTTSMFPAGYELSSATALSLNAENVYNALGESTYSVYLPTDGNYSIGITTSGSLNGDINGGTGFSVDQDNPYVMTFVGTATVTINVNSISGEYVITVYGKTAEEHQDAVYVSEETLATSGREFTVNAETPTEIKFFDGWYVEETKVCSQATYSYDFAEPITLSEKWVEIPTTFVVNIEEAGEVSELSGLLYDGKQTSVTATTNSGYTFVGWYDGETLLSSETTYEFAISATPTVYTAKWTYYTVSTTSNIENMEAWFTQLTDEKVTVGDQVVLEAGYKNDYVFAGWYDGTELLSTQSGYTLVMTAENRVITAKYYELKVKTNGEGGTLNPYLGSFGVGYTITLSANTNAGYTFVGWYANDTFVSNNLTETYVLTTEETVFTAKWIKVTLAVNDDNAGTVDALDGKYLVGDTATATANTNAGYTFVGWYNGDQKVTSYTSYEFAMPDVDTTYTAKWIKVSIEKNIEEAGEIDGLNQAFCVGDTATVTASTNDGYKFLGWFDSEDNLLGSETSYSFVMPSENLTYYAKWQGNILNVNYSHEEGSLVYTVSFDHNGGSNSTASQTVTKTSGLSYPSIPLRESYIFTGWYTESTCENLYDFSAEVTSDITLYAGWWDCNTSSSYYNNVFDMTVYANNSSSAFAFPVTRGAIDTRTYLYFVALRTGTINIAYYNETDNRVTFNVENVTQNEVIQGDTLSQNDTRLNSYNKYISASVNAGDVIRMTAYYWDTATDLYVYFRNSIEGLVPDYGGTAGGERKVVPADESVTLTVEPIVGFVWQGWYNGNTVMSTDYTYTFNMPDGGLDLTAKWAKITVSTELDEGGTASEITTSYVSGDYITLTATLNDGYNFAGWYVDGHKVSGDLEYTFIAPSVDTEYKAVWVVYTVEILDDSEYGNAYIDKSVTVNFDLNKQDRTINVNYEPTAQTIDKTTGLVYPEILTCTNSSSRTQYIFTGWYEDVDCTRLFDFSKDVNENITVYAGWKEIDNGSTVWAWDTSDSSSYSYVTPDTDNVYVAFYNSGTYYLEFTNSTYTSVALNIRLYVRANAVVDTFMHYQQLYNSTDTITLNVESGDVFVFQGKASYVKYLIYQKDEDDTQRKPTALPTSGGMANTIYSNIQLGETVTLIATSEVGGVFLGWFNEQGVQLTSDLEYTFEMTANALVFIPKWYNFAITSNRPYAGTYNAVETSYLAGEGISLVATKNNGYLFEGWYVKVGTASEELLTVNLTYEYTLPSTETDIELIVKYDLCDHDGTMNDDCLCTACNLTLHGNRDGGYCTHTEGGVEYVYMGEYPQTVKADGITIDESVGDSRDYVIGSDGYWYKSAVAVTLQENVESYRATFSDGTKGVGGQTYYFKVEPIKWRVLNKSGTTYTLISELVLDYKKADEDGDEIGDLYQDSTIRTWLNGEFLETAFTTSGYGNISHFIQNSEITVQTTTSGVTDTITDKIYLASYADVTNTDYYADNTARKKVASDYIRAKTTLNDRTNFCYDWWTRDKGSPTSTSNAGWYCVTYSGSIANSKNTYTYGIVPMIQVELYE